MLEDKGQFLKKFSLLLLVSRNIKSPRMGKYLVFFTILLDGALQKKWEYLQFLN